MTDTHIETLALGRPCAVTEMCKQQPENSAGFFFLCIRSFVKAGERCSETLPLKIKINK